MIKAELIGVGTGNFWQNNSYEINEAIKQTYNLGIRVIEITFAFKEEFSNFTISKRSMRLLQEFNFISIHAPKLVYNDNEEIKKLLSELKMFYDLVNANFIVFHPHWFNNFTPLLSYDWNVCIENSRTGKNWNLNKLKELFQKYPQFGFVLDTCHAGDFSKEEIHLLFNEFKDKIKYFHLSAFYKNKTHYPLHLIDNKELEPFKEVIAFGKPLVIELWAPKIEVLKKEIDFLRSKYTK